MSTTEEFKKTIQAHLYKVAKEDEKFSAKLMSKDKNIEGCITYILNQVKESGKNGFTDAEIFGMAVHYYDEKDVKAGPKINARVVVNHSVDLTEEEIKEAKEKAFDQMVEEEKTKLKAKRSKKTTATETNTQTSLF